MMNHYTIKCEINGGEHTYSVRDISSADAICQALDHLESDNLDITSAPLKITCELIDVVISPHPKSVRSNDHDLANR